MIIWLFAPRWGFSGSDQFTLAVQMLRWTFPYLFFISLVSLFSGVLNSYGRFFIPAFTQVIMNLVMIAAAVLFAAHSANPGRVLAMGVFAAGRAAAAVPAALGGAAGVVVPAALASRARGRAARGKAHVARHPGFVDGADQPAADTQIATALVTGSVSWLYFADRLMEFPLGVFSIALATVILPGLSRAPRLAVGPRSSPARWTGR